MTVNSSFSTTDIIYKLAYLLFSPGEMVLAEREPLYWLNECWLMYKSCLCDAFTFVHIQNDVVICIETAVREKASGE